MNLIENAIEAMSSLADGSGVLHLKTKLNGARNILGTRRARRALLCRDYARQAICHAALYHKRTRKFRHGVVFN